MRYIFTLILVCILTITTWGQEPVGEVYNPMPINAAALFLKKETLVNINAFLNDENNFQNGFIIQAAHSPFQQISLFGSFYRNADHISDRILDIQQKMTIVESGIGYYFPKYTTADKQRIKVWDFHLGASFGSASDNRILTRGTQNLPFHDGLTNLSTNFHSYFGQIGFHYILDMKFQLKFGGNLKVARTKIHRIKYRSNFLSQQLENDVIWMPQLSTDIRIGYQGFWVHLQINMPIATDLNAQKYLEDIERTPGDESVLQIGVEKTFWRRE